MKITRVFKKILTLILWLFNLIFAFYIFMQFLGSTGMRLLQAGYIDGGSMSSFIMVVAGIAAIILLSVGLLIEIIASQKLYFRSSDKNLFYKFSTITSIEFYAVSFFAFVNWIVFTRGQTSIDLLVVIISLVLGSILLWLNKINFGQKIMKYSSEKNNNNFVF